MRLAVVGHTEWIHFARVPALPAPGAIVHASHAWEDAGGGGAVAAVQLARLAGGAELFTALGDDRYGHATRERLEGLGVRVHAAWRRLAQRRAFTHLDDAGERTITVLGERLSPSGRDDLAWEELADADAVYFTAGDVEALRSARAARALVATARAGGALLARPGVALEALVSSASDPGERLPDGVPDPPPAYDVRTQGARGGHWTAADGREGRWAAAPLPGPIGDAYGCGDSFAAGLAFGLGRGQGIEEALGLAARCGATCLTGTGPYEALLAQSDDEAEPPASRPVD